MSLAVRRSNFHAARWRVMRSTAKLLEVPTDKVAPAGKKVNPPVHQKGFDGGADIPIAHGGAEVIAQITKEVARQTVTEVAQISKEVVTMLDHVVEKLYAALTETQRHIKEQMTERMRDMKEEMNERIDETRTTTLTFMYDAVNDCDIKIDKVIHDVDENLKGFEDDIDALDENMESLKRAIQQAFDEMTNGKLSIETNIDSGKKKKG